MNYFELEPGESFAGGIHTHYDQEKVFYVFSGRATFDIKDGSVEVAAGELIRFEPGEFQMGSNDPDEAVTGWAFGAPGAQHDWDQIETRLVCGEYEAETGHGLTLTDAGAFELTCTECDSTLTFG